MTRTGLRRRHCRCAARGCADSSTATISTTDYLAEMVAAIRQDRGIGFVSLGERRLWNAVADLRRRRSNERELWSGVERFLDTPVKRYSSGMYLRLAFAVAAHLEPDVLVVDEILAVGDAEFQRKCIGRMQDAEQEGRTLIFVSHDLGSLNKLCQRSLWLEAGTIRDSGPTPGIIRRYLAAGLTPAEPGRTLFESGQVTVYDLRVVPDTADRGTALIRGDAMKIVVGFDVHEEVPGLDLAIMITTSSGARVLDELLSDRETPRFALGCYQAELSLPPLLNLGDYTVGLWFGTQHDDFINQPVAAPFTVHGSDLHRSERILVLDVPFTVQRLGALTTR